MPLATESYGSTRPTVQVLTGLHNVGVGPCRNRSLANSGSSGERLFSLSFQEGRTSQAWPFKKQKIGKRSRLDHLPTSKSLGLGSTPRTECCHLQSSELGMGGGTFACQQGQVAWREKPPGDIPYKMYLKHAWRSLRSHS